MNYNFGCEWAFFEHSKKRNDFGESDQLKYFIAFKYILSFFVTIEAVLMFTFEK